MRNFPMREDAMLKRPLMTQSRNADAYRSIRYQLNRGECEPMSGV